MKRRMVFALVMILGVISGVAWYLYTSAGSSDDAIVSRETTKQTTPVVKETNEPASDMPAAASVAKGTYVDYASDVVATTKGTKILFFHAPWCPQCRSLDADIKVADLPDDTTIIKTDYDTNQKLRQKYGVTLQTTFVAIDDNGELVKKYVAYSEPTYDSLYKNFIESL